MAKPEPKRVQHEFEVAVDICPVCHEPIAGKGYVDTLVSFNANGLTDLNASLKVHVLGLDIEHSCKSPLAGLDPEHWPVMQGADPDPWAPRANADDPMPDDSLTDILHRARAWSLETFGPGFRTEGVVKHIEKELDEIRANPMDAVEWIDVAILALDGAWRTGTAPEDIVQAMLDKYAENARRTWPDWRTLSQDEPSEHIRDEVDHVAPGVKVKTDKRWRVEMNVDGPWLFSASFDDSEEAADQVRLIEMSQRPWRVIDTRTNEVAKESPTIPYLPIDQMPEKPSGTMIDPRPQTTCSTCDAPPTRTAEDPTRPGTFRPYCDDHGLGHLPAWADAVEEACAKAWDVAAEQWNEWFANNPSPSGPIDPPRNPYEAS